MTSIGEFAFGGCGGLDISVDANNPNYSSFGGVLFNKDKTKLLGYAKDKIQSEYTVPDCVENIGIDAFYGCTYLTNITIPKSVKNIERAFSYCGCLDITVDADNPNYSSVDGVLFNKDKTELIAYAKDEIQSKYVVPDGVKSIGTDAFAYCENLKNITMKNDVTNIGDHAFYYCTALTDADMPNSVSVIGDGAFYYCANLIDIYYSGSEENWNNISIGDWNWPLLYANIHYNNHLTKSIVEINNDNIFLKTSLDSLSETEKQISDVFVVLYDENDAVIDSYNAVYDGTEISGALKNDAKADHIKVFVWNKDGSLEPITEAPEYIRINNN